MINELGAKAHTLLSLVQEGVDVPPFIVIKFEILESILTTHFSNYSKLIHAWRHLKNSKSLFENPACELSQWSKNIEAIVLHDFEIKIFNQLTSTCKFQDWIFRPSVSCEDSSNHSFAGCFESYSGSGFDLKDLCRMALKSLASVYSPESLTRILQEGVDPRRIRTSLIFQAKVLGLYSGTATNIDVLNPGRTVDMTEFVAGAGHQLAQGISDQIIRISRNDFEKQKSNPIFNINLSLNLNSEDSPNLVSSSQVNFLSNLWQVMDQVKKNHPYPFEMEWVLDPALKIWVVQVRPLVGESVQVHKLIESGQQWSRRKTLERFPEAMTPMGWSVIQGVFQHNLNDLHEKFFLKSKRTEQVTWLYRNYVYHEEAFFNFEGQIQWAWSKLLLSRRFWSVLFCGLTSLFRGRNWWKYFSGLHLLQKFFEADWLLINANWENRTSINKSRWFNFKTALEAWEPESKSDIIQWIEAHQRISQLFLEDDLAITLMKEALWKALTKCGEFYSLTEQELAFEYGRIDQNVTILATKALDSLKVKISQDPGRSDFFEKLNSCIRIEDLSDCVLNLKEDTQILVQNYFNEQAYARNSWDVAIPTLVDNPSGLASLLNLTDQRYLQDQNHVPADTKKNILNFESERDIRITIHKLQRLMQMDEEQHLNSYLITGTTRILLLKAGSFFVNQGILSQADDIFFLKLSELLKILNEADLGPSMSLFIEKRRHEYEKNRDFFEPPLEIQDRDIAENSSAREKTSQLLQGQARSPGTREGELYFLHQYTDWSKLPERAIIYTCAPEPSLAILFSRINGLATQTGGLLSHGFVSARELGVPGISGIILDPNQTPNGTKVRINGALGTLEII